MYEKKGWYTGDGAYALNGAGQMVAGTAAPSNVLKVVSITDRLGNETQFTYSGTGDYASFSKANGQTSEAKLLAIDTPDGRQVSFTWGSGDQANRIVSITDGTSLAIVGVALAAMAVSTSGWGDMALGWSVLGMEAMLGSAIAAIGSKYAGYIAMEIGAATAGSRTLAGVAVGAALAYSLVMWVYLIRGEQGG